MNIWQALIISVWVALIQGRVWGGAITLNMRFSPLATSLFIGIVLGDVPLAVTTGGAIQLVTMGQVAPGGQMPIEPNVAAAIAVPVTIVSGLTPEASLAIAVPVGILGGYLYQLKQILNTFPLRHLEKQAINLEEKKFTFSTFIVPQLVSIVIHVPILFIALYWGANIVGDVVTQLEGGLAFHVLEVVGGSLGAVGIALLLRIINRKDYMMFFLLAFFGSYLLAPLEISTVSWAVIGVLIAGVYILMNTQSTNKPN